MANTEVKIITLAQLGKYNDKIKKFITDADATIDAKSLKTVKIDGNILKLFKSATPGETDHPDFSIELPKTDLTEINNAINGLKTTVDKLDGDVSVEGSVKNLIEAAKYDDTTIKDDIAKNTTAIETLNGTGDGSVDKKVADAVAKIVANAPEAYDTLQEIATWISTHENSAATMNQSIQTNKTDIANLVKLVGTLPEGDASKTIVEYIDSKVGGVNFSTAIATAKQEAIDAAKTYSDGLAKNYATAEQGKKADTALQEADVATLRTDVAANKASLAEGGATATAIADAKKAGTDAQTSVTNLTKRVESIESTTYVEATDEEINGLFA